MFTKPIHAMLLYAAMLFLALLTPGFAPNAYIFQIVIMSLIYAIAACSMNLIVGYTGQASLAHGAFFGIGAYGVAILTRAGVCFWLALPAGAAAAAVISLLVGGISLRTRGHYFAIVTLCFGVILMIVADSWTGLTGGADGIFGIAQPGPIPLPFVGKIEFSGQTAQYYLVLGFLLLVIFALHRLVHSVFGLTLMAIRNNEPLADSVGINTFAAKLISFVAASSIAGLAGGLYASVIGTVSPSAASYLLTFNFLVYLILGGMATLLGPVVGAFAIPIIMEYLQSLGDYRMMIFGGLLVAVIIYAPSGLVGGLIGLNRKVAARRRQKVAESGHVYG